MTDVEMGFKEVIELHESSLLRSLKEGDEDTDRHGGEGTAMWGHERGCRPHAPGRSPRGDLPAPSSTLDFQPPAHEREIPVA